MVQTNAAVDYGLDVGGKWVTSDRLSGEGRKFEPDTNTLTLNGFISDVADKATFMKYDPKTEVYYYAFIRVENSMNLNIRLEGKESVIGEPYISGHAFERIGNDDAYTYNTFYGIYNPNGNVTVTGSARLKVYTNLRGISASKLTMDGCTGDTVCRNCRGVVDYGTVIPAKGYDTSRWKANCREPAYCSVCKQYCGEKSPDNHTSSPSDYKKTSLCHKQHWSCCGKTVAEPHDYDENGVCRVCLYGCKHSGGEATCREPARCEKMHHHIR